MLRSAYFFVFLFIVSPILLAQEVVPNSPTVVAFGDNKAWMILGEDKDRTYTIGDTKDKIVVPKGFVTDYASTPKIVWLLGLSPHEQYSRAAIIHDYLYWSQGCTREQSDRLMLIAMKESEVGRLGRWLVYQAVNAMGKSSWENNAKELKAGLPRIVPVNYQEHIPPNDSWEKFREVLIKDHIKDPEFDKNPSYCEHGNSTEVPK